ncbi:MAG: PaaI family thioesterase [Promethearchaeota archaeon]|nr:MAG: PaaI family thioesterase [Candidatus Lokiarchaeota archaeon]
MNSKSNNIEKKRKKRSERMIKLFNASRGRTLKNFEAIPPFSKWLNGSIIEAQRGYLEIEFEIREEMSNPTGLLHGGMQCAMMDDSIGMMTATLGYEGFPISIDFHVDYLGKVKVGEKVKLIAKLVREGRNILHATAEIYNMNGELISTGNSNLFKTTYKPDYVKAVDNDMDD